jgi:hypothetical protein
MPALADRVAIACVQATRDHIVFLYLYHHRGFTELMGNVMELFHKHCGNSPSTPGCCHG